MADSDSARMLAEGLDARRGGSPVSWRHLAAYNDHGRKRGCRLHVNSTEKTAGCLRRHLMTRRVILLLTVMLLVTPITEPLWNRDGFLLGGHDVDLGLLCLLMFCGLVTLSAHQVLASPLLSLLLGRYVKRRPMERLLRLQPDLIAVLFFSPTFFELWIDLSVPR